MRPACRGPRSKSPSTPPSISANYPEAGRLASQPPRQSASRCRRFPLGKTLVAGLQRDFHRRLTRPRFEAIEQPRPTIATLSARATARSSALAVSSAGTKRRNRASPLQRGRRERGAAGRGCAAPGLRPSRFRRPPRRRRVERAQQPRMQFTERRDNRLRPARAAPSVRDASPARHRETPANWRSAPRSLRAAPAPRLGVERIKAPRLAARPPAFGALAGQPQRRVGRSPSAMYAADLEQPTLVAPRSTLRPPPPPDPAAATAHHLHLLADRIGQPPRDAARRGGLGLGDELQLIASSSPRAAAVRRTAARPAARASPSAVPTRARGSSGVDGTCRSRGCARFPRPSASPSMSGRQPAASPRPPRP